MAILDGRQVHAGSYEQRITAPSLDERQGCQTIVIKIDYSAGHRRTRRTVIGNVQFCLELSVICSVGCIPERNQHVDVDSATGGDGYVRSRDIQSGLRTNAKEPSANSP